MFGNRNESEISAARRDFECYTLMGVPTLIGKLAYLDELRADAAERYEHWGLERRFGLAPVHHALEDVHSLLARELLSCRLHGLLQDLTSLPLRDEVPERQRSPLRDGLKAPSRLSHAESTHFQLTLDTLRSLDRAAVRPAA
jgi:hypothetical protein